MGCSLFLVFLGVVTLVISISPLDGIGIFVGLFLALLGVYYFFVTENQKIVVDQVNDPNRREGVFKMWVSNTLGPLTFSLADLKPLHTEGKFYIIKPELKKFVFIHHRVEYIQKDKMVKDDFIYKVVEMDKVRKISLKTDGEVIGEISKENGIGRALIGGALFGAAGAIVGSTTAKEKQQLKNEVSSIKLEIITNDTVNPYTTLELYNAKDRKPDTDLSMMEHTVQNLYWALEQAISEMLTTTTKNPQHGVIGPSGESLSDELRKLHALMTDGIIDKAEFEAQKKKLIG